MRNELPRQIEHNPAIVHASLGHEAGVDPKVAADQRGHGIGVALEVYTKAAIGKRAEAAEKLENSIFAA